MTPRIEYQPQTAAATVRAIAAGVDAWLAFGQFLDDWRRTPLPQRPALVAERPPEVSDDVHPWAALVAAAVDALSARDGLEPPGWAMSMAYRLAEPWFPQPGLRLRASLLVDTPTPFRARNIFAGDRILDRV